MVYGHHSGEEA